MEGLIAEGEELLKERADPQVKDAGLISAAQRVEHYEIAGYGTALTYAGMFGDKEGGMAVKRMRVSSGPSSSESVSVDPESASSSSVRS